MAEILESILGNKATDWLNQHGAGASTIGLIVLLLAVWLIWKSRQDHSRANTVGGSAQATGNVINQHFHVLPVSQSAPPPPDMEPVGVFRTPERRRPSDYIFGRSPIEDLPEEGASQPAPGGPLRTHPPRLQSGVVRLDWQTDGTGGLHVGVTNAAPETIHDFRLYLLNLRRYQPELKQFVEVRAFHADGPFVRVQLLAATATNVIGGDTKLFSGDPVRFQFLNRESVQLRFGGRTDDASILDRRIQESGIWEATLLCQAGGAARAESMWFEWHDIGRHPKPYDPTKLT